MEKQGTAALENSITDHICRKIFRFFILLLDFLEKQAYIAKIKMIRWIPGVPQTAGYDRSRDSLFYFIF